MNHKEVNSTISFTKYKQLTLNDYQHLSELQNEIYTLIQSPNIPDKIISLSNTMHRFGLVLVNTKFHELAQDLIIFSSNLSLLTTDLYSTMEMYIEGIYLVMREFCNEKSINSLESFYVERFDKEIKIVNNFLKNILVKV